MDEIVEEKARNIKRPSEEEYYLAMVKLALDVTPIKTCPKCGWPMRERGICWTCGYDFNKS